MSPMAFPEMPVGTQWLIRAGVKSGKTRSACAFAAAAMAAKKCVLFITLEDTPPNIRRRIFEASRAGNDGNLRVLTAAVGEFAPKDLGTMLADLIVYSDFRPDVVCIDNIGLCLPVPDTAALTPQLGSLLEAYQAIAVYRKHIQYLTLQTNRLAVEGAPRKTGPKPKVEVLDQEITTNV